MTNSTINPLENVYKILANENQENVKPLADFVTEKYKEADLSQSQFCKIIGVGKRTWQRIENGEAEKIDISILIKISSFLNIDVKELIQLYVANARVEEIKDLEKSRKFSFIINNFDVKALKNIKFIDSKDFDKIENRITSYFCLNTIYEYSAINLPVAFSRANTNKSDKMLKFWKNIVNYQLRNVGNKFPFDEEKLLTIIPNIRAATLDVENGFANFRKALFACGVTVIVESYFSKTSIRGGTFVVNGKPFIILTNFRNTYPSLWRTFAHELCHVVNDLPEISKQGFHLSGDSNIFSDRLKEDIADDFAERIFLTDENYKIIENYIALEDVVKQYAYQWNVHPSLIYSIYLTRQNDEKEYAKYSQFLIKANSTIRNIGVKEPWKQKNIQDTVKQVNRTFSFQEEEQFLPN